MYFIIKNDQKFHLLNMNKKEQTLFIIIIFYGWKQN